MKKSYLFYAFIIILGSVFAHKESIYSTSTEEQEPLTFETTLITAPNGTIVAEIADTEAKQDLGLSKHQNLLQGHGMLFTYNDSEAQNPAIWMKNKKFPLDIVWLNGEKAVILAKENISPNTYQETEAKLYYSAEPAPYVLLLPAGEVKRLGIQQGAKLAFNLSQEEDSTTPLTYETTIVTAPNGKIKADIADKGLKYTRGLGYRQNLPKGQGMLFPLRAPSNEEMWMKGMNFPIDIIWLNADKKVTLIKANLSPDTYGKTESTIYFSPKPDTLFILELPAGDAERLGIKIGTTLSFELSK